MQVQEVSRLPNQAIVTPKVGAGFLVILVARQLAMAVKPLALKTDGRVHFQVWDGCESS